MSSAEWFFALLGVAFVLIPLGMDALGYAMPRLLAILSVVVGAVCLVGAFALPAYNRWFVGPTYVYLTVGQRLGERSAQAPQDFVARRVFAVQRQGPNVLHNVTITLHDNRGIDQSYNDHVEHFEEIDPGPLPTGEETEHFWLEPATPWDEDYSVAITSHEVNLVENI